MKRLPKYSNMRIIIVFIVLSTLFNVRYDQESHSYIFTSNHATASKLISPLFLQRQYETWGVFFQGTPVSKDFTVQDKIVVLANPFHGCSKFKNEEEVNGNIVMIDSNNCDPQEKAKHAQNANASGVIIAEFKWHPPLTYLTDGKNHADLKVPIVQMFENDFKQLKGFVKNESQIVHMELSPDPNPWDNTYGNRRLWDAHMAFVVTGFAIVLALASYKIYQYWKYNEKAKTKLAILTLVAIYSVVTTIGWIDPIGTTGVWSYRISTLLSSAYFPFGLTTYFLLALYWGSIARGVVPEFTNLKKPFMILTPFFFLAEFGSWPFRYLFISTELILTILLIMYVVGFAAATVFYVKNGIRIIRILNEAAHPVSSPQLRRMTFYILTIATCHGLMSLMFSIYLIIGIGPITNACIYWIHAALMLTAAFSEVQMFAEKKKPTMQLPMEKEMNVINFNMNATQSSTFDSETQ